MKNIGALARERPVLATFSLGCLVTFIALGASIGSGATAPYLLSLVLLIWLAATLHARAPLSGAVLWGLAVWQAAHLAGGILPFGRSVLYGVQLVPVVLRYDQAVHAFGFGVATLACGEVLRARIPGPTTTTIAVMAALAGLGIGALNEVIEFVTSQFIETNAGGYVNTGWDLVANTVGAGAAAAWMRARARPS